MKSELEQYQELVEELRQIIVTREKTIAQLAGELGDLRASRHLDQDADREIAGDSLRDALRAFADRLGDAGEIVNTPNGKYRWIEQQVSEAGL